MPTSAPIWTDSRYTRFFRGAAETIAHARKSQLQPRLSEQEERLHRVAVEICAADVQELDMAGD